MSSLLPLPPPPSPSFTSPLPSLPHFSLSPLPLLHFSPPLLTHFSLSPLPLLHFSPPYLLTSPSPPSPSFTSPPLTYSLLPPPPLELHQMIYTNRGCLLTLIGMLHGERGSVEVVHCHSPRASATKSLHSHRSSWHTSALLLYAHPLSGVSVCCSEAFLHSKLRCIM